MKNKNGNYKIRSQRRKEKHGVANAERGIPIGEESNVANHENLWTELKEAKKRIT